MTEKHEINTDHLQTEDVPRGTPEEEEADFQLLRQQQAAAMADVIAKALLKSSGPGAVPSDFVLIVKNSAFDVSREPERWQTHISTGLHTAEVMGAFLLAHQFLVHGYFTAIETEPGAVTPPPRARKHREKKVTPDA